MANPNQLSTPDKRGSKGASQAGSVKYKQGEIAGDLAMDLQNSVKCGVDDIIKYFLYQVLKEDSKEKKDIDRLQEEIEKLQADRLYKKEGGDGGVPNPENATAGSVHEQARQDTAEDVTKNGTEGEKKKVEQRENIIKEVLNAILKLAFKITEEKDVKTALKEFYDSYGKTERNIYGPFVKLCNLLLDKFKSGKSSFASLPLRDVDKLDIRFLVNDPHDIVSSYPGMSAEVVRRPDCIISSMAALLFLKGREMTPDEYTVNLSNLVWPVVLAAVEFKRYKKNHPEGLSPLREKYTFVETQYTPARGVPHARLEDLDIVEETTKGTGGEDKGDVGTTNKVGSKRDHDAALGPGNGKSANKRSKSTNGTPITEVTTDKTSQRSEKGRVQCASYALEMLSQGPGIHHVVNVLFTDGIFWIWYYDRQGIIQSTGLSVIDDFPRFIVLLIIFQRFSLENWGVIPAFHPEAVYAHNQEPSTPSDGKSKKKKAKMADKNAIHTEAPSVVINLGDDLENFEKLSDGESGSEITKLSRVSLDTTDYLSHKPHCLAGRATAVISAIGYGDSENDKLPMVCKVYHPEVQRRHEGLTMKVVYKIAEKEKLQAQSSPDLAKVATMDMRNHLPRFYFYGDVKGTKTHRIRSMINRNWKGHRTMRIIGMKKLGKVTKLSGWDFVKAWLEGVICHAFLWKNHVEHGDPSISNLMYDEDGKYGVLTDFDLSLLQWEPRVFGTDRTGTVPFMALDLLDAKYWKGLTKRYYHHELESFIWMLPYVFLQYEKGRRHYNELLDPWITSNIDTCREKKGDFYNTRLDDAESMVQSDYEACWLLADALCRNMRNFHSKARDLRAAARRANREPDFVAESKVFFEEIHKLMKSQLEEMKAPDLVQGLLEWFGHYQPNFQLSENDAKSLQKTYGAILGPMQPV